MVAIDLRRFLLFHYPNACFVTLATLLSTISFSFTPSAVPLALNLATLLVYSRIVLPRARALKNVLLLLTGLTLGSAIPKLAASWTALSSPGISLLVLFAGSAITSFFSVCAVLLDAKICMHFPSPWTQITIFPALWASVWSTVAYISPIGRLSAWSPTHGIGAYTWLVPFLGPAAVDWAVAAWAVALSQAFAAWFMSENDVDEVEPLVDQQDHSQAYQGTVRNASHTCSSVYLVVILAALAVPSLFVESYPDPVLSTHTTPLSVGCVLPPFFRYKHHSFDLEDYIEESKKLTASAEVLLWPEGAVVFNNESARDAAFAEVREKVKGSYVGVSFEEMYPDPSDNTGEKGARRNGIALISQHQNKTHLLYYKRKLVPIAESFSLTHSNAPPGMYTIDLPHPKGMNKTDWGPKPKYTRPISVTTSICLDFTAPDLFRDLPSRPSLILAPARTWNVDIGIAMWNQAKQRANELGTMILWCDGGEGGVSGVVGQGYHDVHQVGSGSWIRKVGIDYPHQESRTIFAVIGSYNLVFFWLIALGASASTSQHTVHFLPGGSVIKKVQDIGSSIMSRVRRRREGRILLEDGQNPALVDLE